MGPLSPRAPERSERRLAAFQLGVANLAVSCLVARAWLAHALPADTLLAWIFPRLALVSTVVILSLPVHGLAWLLTRLVSRPRLLGWLLAVLWTAFLVGLWFDTRIFDQFRYHVNGLVWNVIVTQGIGDSVQIASSDWFVLGTLLAAALAGQRALFGWRLRSIERRTAAQHLRRGLFRPRILWLALLSVVAVEKGLYAAADLRRDRSVTSVSRLFPMYMRFTVKGLARDAFGYDVKNRPEVDVAVAGRVLKYPRAPIVPRADGPRPNVLMIVVDSLRDDVLEPRTAPQMSAFARDARRFRDHVSAGNSTRFGLFALLYGIHGVYWHPFCDEQRSPVLVDVLLDLGYDMQVFSTAHMSSPELRSTAWVRIEKDVQDDLRVGRGKAGGDTECARRLAGWLDERGDDAPPWFAFVMLDSPHQQYSFPRENPPFRPFLEKISYLKNDSDLDADERLRRWNSYRNAVHHADSVVGSILSDLEARGSLADTLVMVTGDHGEEFGEHGFFGHTSNFTAAQVQVPFLLAGPGVEPGTEERPTSHVDVPPTILEMLGVDPSVRSDYSVGESLLAPLAERERVSSGWSELALWVDDAILVVPYEAHGGGTTTYTYEWELVLDDEDVLQASSGALLQMARDCARFLR